MKNIVLSLDGLTFRFVKSYLENGQLDANTGLGYLINKGVFVPTTVTTPANTAPVHIAIATGSTSAHNNINNNSFHLIRSPFADQFWLLTDMAPDTANTVVDFTQGTDVLEISGQGAGVNFASLTRTGNSIALNGDVFATLNGFDTTTLTAADFVFE